MPIRRGDGPRRRRRRDAANGSFVWTRDDALVAIGTAAVDVFGYAGTAVIDGEALRPAGLALLVIAALCLLARRRHPVPVLAVVLSLDLALELTAPLPQHFTAGLAVALYSVGRLSGPGPVAGAVALTVAMPLAVRTESWTAAGWGALNTVMAAVLSIGAGLAVGRRQRAGEAKRELLAERAVAEERRRIARELHDIVAHHITTMQLMAGGARANLAHDTEAAREALVILEGSGRTALGEMRQLLRVLRAGEDPEGTPPAPQPGTADLDRIVSEARLAGTRTAFTVDGPVRPLPPSVGLTVFRIVQEALTNTRKHAGRAGADVRLSYRPDHVLVEVRDDGPGGSSGAASDGRPSAHPAPSRPVPGSGYGLVGMRERVALQGGTLEAAPLDGGGFRVAASLPAS
ncbi:sensor histidine kinase [Streptomyces sp. NPDC051130]|uniref:sensor histidine kinase n=1 Tax=Streptomyces sp. NPDC051130 TaxID=3157223 RepID=UPI003439237C